MFIPLVVMAILVSIYFGLPLWAKIVIFIINSFVPDPIPVLDEVLMLVGMINHVRIPIKVVQWIRTHKFLTILIVATIVIVIVKAFSK